MIHIEYTERKTFQRYPQILNEIGDKITLKLKDVDGNPYTAQAEIVAFYKNFVLLSVKNKYRVTVHNTEFGNYKGAKVRWTKNATV